MSEAREFFIQIIGTERGVLAGSTYVSAATTEELCDGIIAVCEDQKSGELEWLEVKEDE